MPSLHVERLWLIVHFCDFMDIGNVDTDIKAGSWLELRVNLKRQMMEVLFDKKDMSHLFEDQDSKGNTSKQYKVRKYNKISCD